MERNFHYKESLRDSTDCDADNHGETSSRIVNVPEVSVKKTEQKSKLMSSK